MRIGYPIDGSKVYVKNLTRRISLEDAIDNTLSVAIINGYADIVDYIIDHGGKITYDHVNLSIETDKYDIFMRLLNTNIKADDDEELLISICVYSSYEVDVLPYLEQLIAYGYNPNIPIYFGGISLLYFTFTEPKITYNILSLLLKAGADPNNYNYDANESGTLITKVLENYSNDYLEKCVDLLLNYGADINIWNSSEKNNNLVILQSKYPTIYAKYFTN